jgi:hypothetical protein
MLPEFWGISNHIDIYGSFGYIYIVFAAGIGFVDASFLVVYWDGHDLYKDVSRANSRDLSANDGE